MNYEDCIGNASGYNWQLLLFFHAEELRLAAAKQRLTDAQDVARSSSFGGDEARGYDAYKESLLVPGYLRWADVEVRSCSCAHVLLVHWVGFDAMSMIKSLCR